MPKEKGNSPKKTARPSTSQKRRKSVTLENVNEVKKDSVVRRSSKTLPPIPISSPTKSKDTISNVSATPPKAARKLLKMSSSVFKDNSAVNDDVNGGVTREVKEGEELYISDCEQAIHNDLPECSSRVDGISSQEELNTEERVASHDQMQASETVSRKLLRKLSSFKIFNAENNATDKDKSIEGSDDSKEMCNKEGTEQTKEENTPPAGGGFLSRMQKSFKFIGNPTASFAEEEGLEVHNNEEHDRGNLTRPTVKSAIVKYFQKNTILKEKQVLTIEKPDEEEASIRQILHEQEQAEENETIERIVFSNKRARSRRMSAEWRKVQMTVNAIGHLKKPVDKNVSSRTQTDSTRSTTYSGHSIYDCESEDDVDSEDNVNTSESIEDNEFANAFFD